MSLSIRERLFGKEDSDDVAENSVTDNINVADDMIMIVIKLLGSLVTSLLLVMVAGKVLNMNGLDEYNNILKVVITVFVVSIVLTLALLIFVYNMVGLLFRLLGVEIPEFDLQDTTILIVEILYSWTM